MPPNIAAYRGWLSQHKREVAIVGSIALFLLTLVAAIALPLERWTGLGWLADLWDTTCPPMAACDDPGGDGIQ